MFERLKTWTISDAIQDRSGARGSSSVPPDFRKRFRTDRSNSYRYGRSSRPINEAGLAKRLILPLRERLEAGDSAFRFQRRSQSHLRPVFWRRRFCSGRDGAEELSKTSSDFSRARVRVALAHRKPPLKPRASHERNALAESRYKLL
jgi:hypothetical protein